MKILLLLALALVVGIKSVDARILDMDVISLVDQSEWIFEGELLSISPEAILHDQFGGLAKGSIKLTREIKGRPFSIGGPTGVLDFLYRPDMGESANIEIGKTYIFFWKQTDGGPILLPGHYGARAIDSNGCFSSRLIGNLPNFTKTNIFSEWVSLSEKIESRQKKNALLMELIKNNDCPPNKAGP